MTEGCYLETQEGDGKLDCESGRWEMLVCSPGKQIDIFCVIFRRESEILLYNFANSDGFVITIITNQFT
jgi:hypothetical protein